MGFTPDNSKAVKAPTWSEESFNLALLKTGSLWYWSPARMTFDPWSKWEMKGRTSKMEQGSASSTTSAWNFPKLALKPARPNESRVEETTDDDFGLELIGSSEDGSKDVSTDTLSFIRSTANLDEFMIVGEATSTRYPHATSIFTARPSKYVLPVGAGACAKWIVSRLRSDLKKSAWDVWGVGLCLRALSTANGWMTTVDWAPMPRTPFTAEANTSFWNMVLPLIPCWKFLWLVNLPPPLTHPVRK